MARLLFPLQQPEYIVRPLSPLTADEAKELEFLIRPWDEAWDNLEHLYYLFSGDELEWSGRAIDKSVEEQRDPTVQSLAQQYMKTFGCALPHYFIRRHEMSRWIGEPLIEFKPLCQRKGNNIFLWNFHAAIAGCMTQWTQDGTRRLHNK